MKRRKTQPINNESAPQPERSEPWFDDGNIVLQAELSQFRVYRGILSIHSVIFKDMFALAKPSGDVEGCPVVQLSDRAEEIGVVLKVLHNSEHCYLSLQEVTMTLDTVTAFLRIGTKYEIAFLRAEAIRRLSADYPSDWLRFDQSLLSDSKRITYQSGHHIDAVILAREMDVLSILPAALYQCSALYSSEVLLKGSSRMDGSLAILSVEDRELCLLAREKLTRLQAAESFAWLMANDTCRSWEADCSSVRAALVKSLLVLSPECLALHQWMESWETGLCKECTAAFRTSHVAGCRKIWALLPSIFNLSPWEELLKT